MDSLWPETNSVLENIHRGLSSLERSTTAVQAEQIEGRILKQLELVNSNCNVLDSMVNREPLSKRRAAKYRVDQLRYDCQHIRAALFALSQRVRLRFERTQEREELISRRFTPNDSTTVCLDDVNLAYNDRLKTTNRQVEDLLDSGLASLGESDDFTVF